VTISLPSPTARYFFDGDRAVLLRADCLDALAAMPEGAVHSVVTDPPYGLEFMGEDWDSFRPSAARIRTRVDGRTNPREGRSVTATPESYVARYPFQSWCERWAAECLRVLKPGGYLLAFGGARTHHRLACAIEDAGFEIRDTITWMYASGFPKSLDVGKAIDRARDDRTDIVRVTSWLAERAAECGVTRAQVDAHMGTSDMAGWWLTALAHRCQVPTAEQWDRLRGLIGFGDEMDAEVARLNARKGEEGEAWKTAKMVGVERRFNEPGGIVKVGQGERVAVTRYLKAPNSDAAEQWQGWGTALKPASEPIVVARKPLSGTVAANVLAHGTGALNIDGCRIEGRERTDYGLTNATRSRGGVYGTPTASADFDAGKGRWPTNVVLSHAATPDGVDLCVDGCVEGCPVAELGESAKFFPVFRYQAKAPARERPRVDGLAHPTVKPLALMRWLVRLVTPPGGRALDPFVGSGTTLQAGLEEGVEMIGVERNPQYVPLIRSRFDRAG
jgi:DNA modification methylase